MIGFQHLNGIFIYQERNCLLILTRYFTTNNNYDDYVFERIVNEMKKNNCILLLPHKNIIKNSKQQEVN